MLEGVVNGPLTYFAAHMNYTMAEAHCVSIGGHLASVHSTQENSVLTSLCHYEECWIGFNDIDEEGSWKWIDGTVGSYSVAGGSEGFLDGFEAPWQPGEPNGKYWEKTDGAYVYPATNLYVQAGSWDDDDISKERAFVCRQQHVETRWAPSPPPPPPRPTRVGPFVFVASQKDWVSAEAECVGLGAGGHLASVHSKAENDAVSELCHYEECWLGFNDRAVEGTWVWSDGSAASFDDFENKVAPWNPGEPNGHSTIDDPTDGCYMYPANNPWVVAGSWDDDDVGKARAFVCRLPLPPPPPRAPPVYSPPPLAPGGGGGGGVGVFFLVVFILGGIGGSAYYAVRQRRAGQPIVPPWVAKLGQPRAQTRPASDAAVYANGMLAAQDVGSATSYAPPMASPGSALAPPVFSGVVNTAPPPAGRPGGGWS